ncbi:PHP domain-containing protein [Palaeococcus ferrophilus]|uniref:PHP domain-containing protein n=1 Tax=Palaeococcus ferrophilus TaxID=83868 RepID=UPI000A0581B5
MDLHTHTVFSDGIGDVLENVAVAEDRVSLLGISDHLHYLSWTNVNHYLREIARAKEESEITVLAGVEANIMETGTDITDAIAERLDYVIASVHMWFEPGDAWKYLELVKLALRDRNVDVIGHFGNVFPYIGYPSWEELLEVIEVAEEEGKAFEISSRYKVPDLEFVRECVKRGVKLTLGSDAHRPQDVGRIGWSERMFRLAGGKKEDLLFSEFL